MIAPYCSKSKSQKNHKGELQKHRFSNLWPYSEIFSKQNLFSGFLYIVDSLLIAPQFSKAWKNKAKIKAKYKLGLREIFTNIARFSIKAQNPENQNCKIQENKYNEKIERGIGLVLKCGFVANNGFNPTRLCHETCLSGTSPGKFHAI